MRVRQVMNTMLPSAPMEQRLRIGLTFYSQNADVYGLIDDETSSEEEDDEVPLCALPAAGSD